jgi:hypothetical protein
MNVFFDFRTTINFTLNDNIDINKLIKSIKKLNKVNDNLFILRECNTSDVNDNRIYITIENNNFKLNFSHRYYDGYSIVLINQKIDQIYKDEIKNYKFIIYDLNYSRLKLITNNIRILTQLTLKTIYKRVIKKKNKETFKILKTKLNEVSTKEIIYYILNKFEIENYCLILNARKIYNKYENVLGNLVYFSQKLNKNNEIRQILQNDNKISLEKKLNNSIPDGVIINSYLNFNLPSFLKYLKVPHFCNDYITIHPINTYEKYILVEYYH